MSQKSKKFGTVGGSIVSIDNSRMNMLDVSNNNATRGETVGIRTPVDDLVIDNNLFYENDETPEDEEQQKQSSSRPLNTD